MKYRCLRSCGISLYDENGKYTKTKQIILEGSIWKENKKYSDKDTIHLEPCSKENSNYLRVSRSVLYLLFEEIK